MGGAFPPVGNFAGVAGGRASAGGAADAADGTLSAVGFAGVADVGCSVAGADISAVYVLAGVVAVA